MSRTWFLPDVRFDLGKSALKGEMHRKQQQQQQQQQQKQAKKKQTNKKQKQSSENFENLWTQGPITVNCRL